MHPPPTAVRPHGAAPGRLALLLFATLLGCSLAPFEPTVSPDGGLDASPATDAGRDANVETDAGSDAGPPDAACAAAELCNGVDDDCDPTTPDGADEPMIGAACDGTDADACEEGTIRCRDGALDCSDATDDAMETCNALDDDCDGAIDEGTCPCDRRESGGRTYFFCTTYATWNAARTACETFGYDLVTIEDAAEDDAVTALALAIEMRDWWIGLDDRAEEGTFTWVSGSTATFRDWGVDQPNDLGGQDCVQIDDGSQAFEMFGRWSDTACADENPFVCEAP